MNSSSVSTPSKDDEQGNQVRRSISTPADDRFASRVGDTDSDEEGRFESPWNAMLGSIGDTLPTSDTGSYVYLLTEGEEYEDEAEEEEHEAEEEEHRAEEEHEKEVEVDKAGVEEELARVDLLKYDDEYSDIVLLENDDTTSQTDDSVSEGNSRSASVISIPSQGTWASDSLDNLVCSGSCQWAWVVANLMYRKYGEKMSRLRNNIADRLINFRSQSFFKSAITFKPQPLPENDDVSMLPLMMKN